MKRLGLFLLTNIAVLAVLFIVMRVFGVGHYLDEQGVGLDLGALLAFSAVIGFTGSFISLLISKWSAKRMVGAQVITNPRSEQESWLVSTVRRQANAAGIGMPEVAIYQAPEMNAFATGWNKNKALVAVSTGLMQQMTSEEVEAVLAHEVSHIANGDMVTMALVQGVVNTFVIFLSRVVGHVVDRAVFKTESGHGPGFYIVAFITQILFGILASAITMWFSRHREFRADAGGAKLASRQKMIAALEKLRGGAHRDLPDQLAAFGISGNISSGFRRFFMSHPPLSERIAALKSAS
ncbi:MAG: protease HtpX [Xanthomonadaceae bacterium]|nr:protease HtpX [Xanthomonadaceae bacterium]